MPKGGSVSMNIDKLHTLVESMRNKPHIQVGVFTDKTVRDDGPLTNADLASYHEYGSPKHGLPSRSMLRTPIADHANEIMAPIKGKADELLKKYGALKLYKLIGIACEKVVLGAFKTGGYGKWAPLKYSTILRKLLAPSLRRKDASMTPKQLKARMRKIRKSLPKRKGTIAQIYAGQIGQGILIDKGELMRSFSSRVIMKFI